MHHLNLVSAGEGWDHRTFKSKENIEIRIPADFPKRTEILGLMEIIEGGRILLCYGKRKPEGEIIEVVNAFQKLKEIIFERTGGLYEEK